MKTYLRSQGKKAGAIASLHEYRNGAAKIEIELSHAAAKTILDNAMQAGGRLPMRLSANGQVLEVDAVGARIDSFEEHGKKIGGTGVIEFSALEEKGV